MLTVGLGQKVLRMKIRRRIELQLAYRLEAVDSIGNNNGKACKVKENI